MKIITIKEAKDFDREAFRQGVKDKTMDIAIEWFNRILERVYPFLSHDEWYYYNPTPPITEFATMAVELKEMYNKNGFDFEWKTPYIHFKIKLLNEKSNN